MIKLDERKEETKVIIQEWLTEAKEMTTEKLESFIKHLMNDYKHDYGTMVHAVSTVSIAAMWAVNREEQGGISGFQASCIMWQNITNWCPEYKDKPLRLLDYSQMLYPQSTFDTISPGTWEYLQTEARKKITESKDASPKVLAHWQSIADGVVPFNYTIED